jgi:aminopeptidase N
VEWTQSLDKNKFLKIFHWTAFFALCSAFFWPGMSLALEGPVHHEITVKLDPDQKSAQIKDVLTVHLVEENDFVLKLFLHGNFWLGSIKIPDNTDFIIETTRTLDTKGEIPLTQISIRKITDLPWPDFLVIEFEYGGKVFDPQNPENADSANTGIFLSGASFFYPKTQEEGGPPDLMTFQLSVNHPLDWKVVSQGRKMAESKKNYVQVVWEATHPMEDIILIANRFKEFQAVHNGINLYAYLLKPEPELANKYFSAAKKYLDFYEKLIGPYPYPKFALIENALQTGYGMPSFTFMGSKVIRFPFILNTSYPHEILHNWWGNSVYIDPDNGNWAEGLTAYLSDHLLLELEGKGSQYRLQQLIKILNYVNESNDFPLINFKWRTSMSSQAIGYGKMLMMLHMLRLQIGDDFFLKALREFHRDRQFRFAGLDDLRISFEAASGQDLSSFFAHWTYRKGGPELTLSSATHVPSGSGHQLHIEVKQTQAGPAFPFKLPVAIWTKDKAVPQIKILDMTEKTLKASFLLTGEPGRVLIDPYTEIFRKLDHREVPPAIGQTYGSPLSSRIMPTEEDFPDVLMGYHEFAQSLVKDSTVMGPLLNDGKSSPAPNGSLWVFGKTNTYARHLKPQLENYGVQLNEEEVVIDGKSFTWKDHSFVFTLQRPGGREGSATWVIASSGESIPGLIRKLPHYGKYGVLVFKGHEPENKFKGTWPFQPSGLMKTFQPGNYSLPPQAPLVDYKPN